MALELEALIHRSGSLIPHTGGSSRSEGGSRAGGRLLMFTINRLARPRQAKSHTWRDGGRAAGGHRCVIPMEGEEEEVLVKKKKERNSFINQMAVVAVSRFRAAAEF